MNWQTQLKNATRATNAIVTTTPQESITPAQLRDAAKRFAARPRQDAFTLRSHSACLDMAEKLANFGIFASAAQRGYAEKLILWSQPRPAAAKPDASAQMTVPNLFTVLQKHTTFHAGDLKISRKNQDTLCWVIWKDQCVGKIDSNIVTLFGKRLGADKPAVVALLQEFEANPLVAAVKYGRLSGRCCSCGRDLTDPVSIEAGIGPICATKFS
jgi:hypothetical protein